jgi:hypothetical protein
MFLAQVSLVRRVVRKYIVTSVNRAKPAFESYIAEHLQYPGPFPFKLSHSTASILEIRQLKITPRIRADYPPVDIRLAIRISMTALTQKQGVDLGPRTFSIDVEFDAVGTVQGNGYDVAPRRARMAAWWGY